VPVKPGDNLIPLYAERLIDEINSIVGSRELINADTLYFGGGTPSILGVDNITRIIGHVKKKFRLSDDSEITIEMNPDHLTKENLRSFAAAGINRIVLGVQTLSDEMRNKIGRKGKLCRQADLDLFFTCGDFKRSIDIIGGLPGQRWEDFSDDIEKIIFYRPDHISFYLLSLEKGTPLSKRFNPDDNFENLQLSLWEKGIELLKSKGYEHYEISSFALNRAYSRHNMKYWTFQPYIGFGPGAHSFFENRRYHNRSDLKMYLSGSESLLVEDIRTSSDAAVEFIMTSLRLLSGFRPARFREVTGYNLPEEIIENIVKLKSEGLIAGDGDLYRVTPEALSIFDTIVYRITEPLL
jgi:oxygen-independent coproporphyrinogen-3 oxidase